MGSGERSPSSTEGSGSSGGLLVSVLYNFLAGVVGGIEIQADGIGRDSIPGS